MSEESKAEKFLELFKQGKEFTEELLRENQRLRYRLASTIPNRLRLPVPTPWRSASSANSG